MRAKEGDIWFDVGGHRQQTITLLRLGYPPRESFGLVWHVAVTNHDGTVWLSYHTTDSVNSWYTANFESLRRVA